MGKNTKHFLQFVRYGVAGGLATVAHIIVFHLTAWKIFPALQHTDFFVTLFDLSVPVVDVATRSRNAMLSNAVAFVCGNLVAYVLNILWVFEAGRHKRIVEISLFYVVSGISIGIGTAVMGFLISQYGLQTTHAFVANLVAAVMVNYLARKFYIFKG